MKKIKNILVCMLLLCSLSLSVISGNAASEKKYNLNLIYKFGDVVISGAEVEVYKVADIKNTGEYLYVNEFKNCSADLNSIYSQGQWNKVSDTISSYAVSKKIKATQKKISDKKGKVKFTELEKGLYFVPSVTVLKDSKKYIFDSFMITVTKNTTANPKCETIKVKDKLVEYEIVIKWDDMDNNDKRPDKVIVDIYKDGEFFEEAELSEDNDWSYTWETNEDGSKWDVVQSDTPEGYNDTIEKVGNKFVITNKRNNKVSYGSNISSPQTGDSTTLLPYIFAMSISGMVLLLVAVMRKRRENVKEK